MKARFVDRIVYVAARTAIGIASRVPERIGYGIAAALGRLYFRCSRRRQQCALRFLRAAYPQMNDRERLRIGRIATGNICKVPIDMAKLTRLLARGGSIREVVDVGDAAAIVPQKPYLAVTAHFGSWEVAAVTMAQLAGEAHGVARTFKNPLLQRWILHNRRSGGLHIHPRRGGIKPLAHALREGGVGLQVVDQHQRARGVIAPFFGQPASCERAASSLALRGRYPVLVGGAIRVGHGFSFRMAYAPLLVPEPTGDRDRDLLAFVTAMNERLEWLIQQAPEQYLWIHDRYREGARPAVGGDDGDSDDAE